MSRVIVVTGTDTGVGKTIATAALAACLTGSVRVVKPTQTGLPARSNAYRAPTTEPSDADEIHRLTGVPVEEFIRLPDPLAPDTAARLRGTPIPTVRDHVARIRALSDETVIVEGAGGLLVRLDTEGGTLLDLAVALDAEVYVVCRAGLGTLNHTELTVTTLRSRGIEPAGLIIGAWPEDPDLASRCNRDDLPLLSGVPLVGVLPEGASRLGRDSFRRAARNWTVPLDSQPSRSTSAANP